MSVARSAPRCIAAAASCDGVSTSRIVSRANRGRRGGAIVGAIGLFSAALLHAGSACAQPALRASESILVQTPMRPLGSPTSSFRRIGSVAAAMIPGLVLHGAGHWALGEREAARRLFAIGTAGTGLAAAGGLVYLASGSSRNLAGVSLAMTLSGAALVALSWIADLQGTLAPAGGSGTAFRRPPWARAEGGYLTVVDPQFGVRHVLTLGAELRWRSLRFAPSVHAAMQGEDWQARLLVAWRFLGPRPDAPAADGTFLDLETAVAWREDLAGGFMRGTTELFLHGRLDLARIGQTLRGSFAELGLGLAITGTASLDVPNNPWDMSSLLLVRVGYGLYLGRPGARHAEIMAYYDHRHDGYPGGLLWAGLFSGTFGRVGLVGTVRLGAHWGISAEAQLGSAFTSHLRLLYHWGESQ